MGLGGPQEQDAQVAQLQEELGVMRQRLDHNPEVKRFAGWYSAAWAAARSCLCRY